MTKLRVTMPEEFYRSISMFNNVVAGGREDITFWKPTRLHWRRHGLSNRGSAGKIYDLTDVTIGEQMIHI